MGRGWGWGGYYYQVGSKKKKRCNTGVGAKLINKMDKCENQ